jgi:hypothetical protein
MKKQFKIILSNSSPSDSPGSISRPHRISRIKLTLLAIITVILAFGALIIALILGYILAAIFLVAIVISGIGIALVRALQKK